MTKRLAAAHRHTPDSGFRFSVLAVFLHPVRSRG
jgi:hypothetical protein